MPTTAGTATAPPPPPPTRLTTPQLLRGLGGGRYACAALVSSLGGGLIRPFLLLYAVTISGISAGRAGLALSVGFLVGIALVPLAGRWVDRGARRALMATTLTFRASGLLALLLVPGADGFLWCCLLQGIGNQAAPIGQAAIIGDLSVGYERDAVLAALRSLGNAGTGAGALLATVAVSSGGVGMRWLAVGTAAGYLISAALVSTVRIAGTAGSAGTAAAPRSLSLTTRVGDLDRPVLRRLTLMNLANLPFAFCFDILEVALPVVLVTRMHAAPAWSSGVFVGNTAMVILAQLPVVLWSSRRPRRHVFALAGWVLAASYLGFLLAGSGHGNAGAGAVALVCVPYTLGEILYTGVGTALVIDAAPPHLRGRVIARWQLSLGLGRALAPLTITAALSVSAAALWLPLAAATVLGAGLIVLHAPTDTGRPTHPGPDPTRRERRNRAALERAELAHALHRDGYRRPDRVAHPALHGPWCGSRPRR
ncbi:MULTISPECIES: MFS transporter [Streptacidiphilus]|uniref:MFS transporter n=1 Tax=Streptacidiphilus cavernicola TaxID=3342716 RepID=A0ABV6UL87_9ACTN|nr:MFS transporter [Streptacidiphilus jeojiense]